MDRTDENPVVRCYECQRPSCEIQGMLLHEDVGQVGQPKKSDARAEFLSAPRAS